MVQSLGCRVQGFSYLWLAGHEGRENKMETAIGFRRFRVREFSYLWLTGSEGMENKMETTTGFRVQGFLTCG